MCVELIRKFVTKILRVSFAKKHAITQRLRRSSSKSMQHMCAKEFVLQNRLGQFVAQSLSVCTSAHTTCYIIQTSSK